MNNQTITPKFGDFLLKDGTYTSQKVSAEKVRGIYLTDGITLINFSPNKKTYSKAYQWCQEHGGDLPTVKALFFIFFHLDEINQCRESIGWKPLPRNLLAWSVEYKQGSGYLVYNHAVDLESGHVQTLISQSMLMDDCGVACPVCVTGEPPHWRFIL